MTIKDAYLYLLCMFINSKCERVEDYSELRNITITFSADKGSILEDKRIFEDYNEMQKVFFTTKENKFGHSYKSHMIGPDINGNKPIEDIINILKSNNNTRKAVLYYTTYGYNKVPCLNLIHFLIRNNNLDVTYYSRAQDIYKKFPCDALCVIDIANYIAEELNIKNVILNAHINSAHIYDSDIEDMKCYINDNVKIPRTIITGNKKKYIDYEEILKKVGIDILYSTIDIPEIQKMDSLEVAQYKAKCAYDQIKRPVWVDDMSLRINDTNFPGPFTKQLFSLLQIDDLKKIYGDVCSAVIECRLCCFDGIKYHQVIGYSNGIIDFRKKIEDIKMPLNSIFKGNEFMEHRNDAISKLIIYLNK